MSRIVIATSLLTVISSLASVSVALADRMEAPVTRNAARAMRRVPNVPDVPSMPDAPETSDMPRGEPAPGSHFARPPTGSPHTAGRAPILDRATVRARLIENRAANLERFREYQQRGVFPSNVYRQGTLNVWRDQAGHLCAAATIINASGAEELVERVADQTNFIRLADVKQGPLMDWILTSGFTQDEIAAIQKPYMPVTDRPDPAPSRPIVVDARLRRAETARLVKRYQEVDAMIVRQTHRSIELAVDRLMKRHDLAWQLIDQS